MKKGIDQLTLARTAAAISAAQAPASQPLAEAAAKSKRAAFDAQAEPIQGETAAARIGLEHPAVREAGPADVAGIVGLLRDVVAENRWVRTEVPFDAAARERHMLARMKAGELVSFVAESAGMIVGELSLRIRGERAVFGMVVAREQRRRGLGRQLVGAAIAKARERSVTCIEIEVYAHNRAARGLYRSVGFVEYGVPLAEERHNGNRWTIIRMRKATSVHQSGHN